MSNFFEDRESQIAISGAIVSMEALVKYDYIKPEDIKKVEERIEIMRSKITNKSLLKDIEESKID